MISKCAFKFRLYSIINKKMYTNLNTLIFSTLSIRGRLGSITPLARNVGVLIGYSVGAIVDYEHRPYIFVFFPIMYLFWLYSLPNTPQYYLHKGDYKVSNKKISLTFLKMRSQSFFEC